MHPIITIFAPFTRRWAIDAWLANLANVEHDPALTNLAVIIDGDEPYIARVLQRFADDRGYRSFHMKQNHGWAANEIRLTIRRQRVAEIHEQAKDLIAKCDGDYVIGLEDDTVFDRLPNFDRLLHPLQNTDDIGFVEGVQMGRWGAQMIGAWLADDVHNPQRIETLLPVDSNGYQEITGGGWYGYATRKRLFLDAPYFASPSMPWGPDVNYGFWLQQQGYRCLIDWSTIYGHDDHGQTLYSDDEKVRLVKIIYNKRADNGKWERQDHEQTRF
jgi:hypothetical protein